MNIAGRRRASTRPASAADLKIMRRRWIRDATLQLFLLSFIGVVTWLGIAHLSAGPPTDWDPRWGQRLDSGVAMAAVIASTALVGTLSVAVSTSRPPGRDANDLTELRYGVWRDGMTALASITASLTVTGAVAITVAAPDRGLPLLVISLLATVLAVLIGQNKTAAELDIMKARAVDAAFLASRRLGVGRRAFVAPASWKAGRLHALRTLAVWATALWVLHALTLTLVTVLLDPPHPHVNAASVAPYLTFFLKVALVMSFFVWFGFHVWAEFYGWFVEHRMVSRALLVTFTLVLPVGIASWAVFAETGESSVGLFVVLVIIVGGQIWVLSLMVHGARRGLPYADALLRWVTLALERDDRLASHRATAFRAGHSTNWFGSPVHRRP